MKKSLFFIIIINFLFCAVNPMFSHKEWVHQYIIKEAYKLLYNEVGTIDPLYKACGFDQYGNENYGYDHDPENWTPNFPSLRGAYVEDSDDILLSYGFWSGYWDASSGHFWQADEGDWETTDLPFTDYDAINAFDKARRYYFSNNSIHIEPYGIPVKAKIWPFKPKTIYTNSIWVRYHYYYLDDFINTGNVVLDDWNWKSFDSFWQLIKTSRPSLNNIDQYPNFGNITNKYVYGSGIIGRICHLLADMSVPAHTHNDDHPCKISGSVPWGANGDVFELNMGHGYDYQGNPYTWERQYCDVVPDETFYAKMHYNQTTARQKSGIIWEAFEINTNYEVYDVLHYLFYTLNQLSDLYPSKDIDNGDIDAVGNRNLINQNNGQNPYLNFRYNYLNPAQNDVNVGEQADELFNYAVRATATLMYWMSWRLGWLNHDPLCRKDVFYLQNERIFGHHIDKQYNNLEFKVEDYSQQPTSGRIIAGKNVHPNPIIPVGDVIVDPSVNLTLTAAKEIVLKDGFMALAGSNFHARITNVYCYTPPPKIIAYSSESKVNFIQSSFNSSIDGFNIFPNPASHSTEIQIYPKVRPIISLEIYNFVGEKITELLNCKQHSTGNINFSFDASSLPSGVYFCTLKTPEYAVTKQFVVVR